MSDSTTPPSDTLVAGKYQLKGMIGRGGMGSVWEGRHVSLGTRVAVKFIEKEYAESPEARARFLNEARAAATISSKFAVQIFDHGVTDDGRPYIVMELLEGEGLDRRLERLGRIPLQDVARAILQVCRALQRAHDGGIIHRDLKPENIFLQHSHDDDEETAKVLDFGIAKIRSVDGNTLSSSTKTGAVLGTPYYMSPEQARGLRDIDHRTDLWSLGVIAFKCVTGVLPFDGQSLGDLLVKICTAPLPIPSQVLPGLPPAFDAWFARALDREPSNRFSSSLELADALAFAAGLTVKRGPGSIPRPQFHAAGAGPVIHGTPAPTPITGGPAFGATSAPLTATSPGTGRSSGALIAIALGMLVLGAGGVTLYKVVGSKAGTTAAPTVSATPIASHGVASPLASISSPTLVIAPLPVAPAGQALAPASSTASTKTTKTKLTTGKTSATLPPPLPKPEPTKPVIEAKPKPDTKVQSPAPGSPGF